MIEKVKGLSICGRCFSRKTNLAFFPNDNDRIAIPLDGVFHGYDELDHERIDLDFCWVPLEDLKKGTKVYPLELIPYILEPGKEIVHFVSKQI